MARGTTRQDLRNMLKAECGYNMQVGVGLAQDTELNQILDNTQQWLWSQFQWPFLFDKEDIAIVGQQRFYPLPTMISLDYPVQVEAKWGDLWYPVTFGIRGEEYEAVDPDKGQVQDPISRYQIVQIGTKIEVWPSPASGQTLRFWGTSRAPLIATPDSSDESIAVLDDLLIVLYAAAEKLGRAKQPDAAAKLQRANALFHRLKGTDSPNMCMTIGGGPEAYHKSKRTVTVVGNPNH